MNITSIPVVKESVPSFPGHYRSKNNGTIVLAFDKTSGIVVSSTKSSEPVGHFYKSWAVFKDNLDNDSFPWERVEHKTEINFEG